MCHIHFIFGDCNGYISLFYSASSERPFHLFQRSCQKRGRVKQVERKKSLEDLANDVEKLLFLLSDLNDVSDFHKYGGYDDPLLKKKETQQRLFSLLLFQLFYSLMEEVEESSDTFDHALL